MVTWNQSETQRNASLPEVSPEPQLQPFELDLKMLWRNNIREIDCYSNVARWVGSRDDAMILVDELPKRRD
jgi:hypothetical protein